MPSTKRKDYSDMNKSDRLIAADLCDKNHRFFYYSDDRRPCPYCKIDRQNRALRDIISWASSYCTGKINGEITFEEDKGIPWNIANDALIAASTRQSISVGDIVRRIDGTNLASGCSSYKTAVCVLLQPFTLISPMADMKWTSTVSIDQFYKVGLADSEMLQRCLDRLDRDSAQSDQEQK